MKDFLYLAKSMVKFIDFFQQKSDKKEKNKINILTKAGLQPEFVFEQVFELDSSLHHRGVFVRPIKSLCTSRFMKFSLN